MLSIGILASGHLGFETLQKIVANYKVKFVFTDSKSTTIIDFCKQQNIALFKGNPRHGKANNFIKKQSVDVIASINYLFLIEDDIINHPKQLIFNIHGSLLPKYRGRTPHVWAIINGESKAGITAHKIEIGCDTGDIIEQIEVPILSEDTGADMLKKYEKLYFPLVDKILKKVKTNQLIYTKQDESKATYFGKRTPKDGQIDWHWTSLQIKNWVRAQADPYPGAFTFYETKKIIIDQVSITKEAKTKYEPGTILDINPNIKIATSDGIVILKVIRDNLSIFGAFKKFS
jgi:methionyl-tRNA formyltransferase